MKSVLNPNSKSAVVSSTLNIIFILGYSPRRIVPKHASSIFADFSGEKKTVENAIPHFVLTPYTAPSLLLTLIIIIIVVSIAPHTTDSRVVGILPV